MIDENIIFNSLSNQRNMGINAMFFSEEDGVMTEQDYYNLIITLTAVASFNREEGINTFDGKSILIGVKNPDIKRHVEVYKSSVERWKLFFDGKITLKDMILLVHKDLMPIGKGILDNSYTGKFRNVPIFIGGINGEQNFMDASFIPPNYEEIESGLQFIDTKIKQMAKDKHSKLFDIAGFLHYALAVLHPFHDGNGRVARILAISLLEYSGSYEFRGFTFISEMLKDRNSSELIYDSSLRTEESSEFTKNIKKGGIHFFYNKDGGKGIEEIKGCSLQDYLNELDLESPCNVFHTILNIVFKSEIYLRYITKLLYLSKNLPGDHVLLWKLINLVITDLSQAINKGNFSGFETIITSDILYCFSHKIKKNSVRNLLYIIDRLNKEFEIIKITLDNSFYTDAFSKGLVPKTFVNTKLEQILL